MSPHEELSSEDEKESDICQQLEKDIGSDDIEENLSEDEEEENQDQNCEGVGTNEIYISEDEESNCEDCEEDKIDNDKINSRSCLLQENKQLDEENMNVTQIREIDPNVITLESDKSDETDDEVTDITEIIAEKEGNNARSSENGVVSERERKVSGLLSKFVYRKEECLLE